MMTVSELRTYGIPETVIGAWQKRQGDILLPVQSRAVRQGLLAHFELDRKAVHRNMVISAPTSAGKSFCAELAIAKGLAERRKSIYLVPLKSLAEQRHCAFLETYVPLGVRCLIVTGDHPDHDAPFAAGEYDIAVVIYEKLDLLLCDRLDLLQSVGLLIVDEMQTIAEPGRGPVLERLLTTVLASVYNPQIIALSAVIGDRSLELLANWLGASIVEEHARPVELLRGVLVDNQYTYRSFNAGHRGQQQLTQDSTADNHFDMFAELVKADSGATLVFLKSRRETIERAIALAAQVNWPAAQQAVEALGDEEPSFLNRTLRQALSRGVAFHNADLTARQRRIIEDAFLRKEVRVLFSTTTLAMGVNLSADTVFLETVKYAEAEYEGRPSLVPVSRAEFDNMTGRAGRFASERPNSTGRAIIMAQTPLEQEILWDAYIAPQKEEPLLSAFSLYLMSDWLLHGIVSGLVHSSASAEQLFAKSLYTASGGVVGDIPKALNTLVDAELVSVHQSSTYAATSLGCAVAASGLSISQTMYLLRSLASYQPASTVEWLALAVSIPDWRMPTALLTQFEYRDRAPLKSAYRRYEDMLPGIERMIPSLRAGRPDRRTLSLLKCLLLLDDWRAGVPIPKLEERYGIHHGQIISLGETIGHLVRSIATIREVTEQTASCTELYALAFSLRTGLPPELQHLHNCFGSFLQRRELLALRSEGITTASACASLSDEQLHAWIHGISRLHQFKEILTHMYEEVVMHTSGSLSTTQHLSPLGSTQPNLVEVDGTQEGERYVIRINGQPVRLTAKSFKYFAKLAWARVNSENGWLFKEEIEVGFNQARYLYRMKQEISSGNNLSWQVIENNRLGYYRLAVTRDQIQVNVEALRTSDDYELRKLAETELLRTVN